MEALAFDLPPQPAVTPGEWFARRYPAVVQQWGAPILEAVVADQKGNRLVKPLELNDNFFAAIISDPQLGHSVVFYEPEQQWLFLDPADQLFHTTTEAKIIALLSSLLVRCAEEMPRNIDLIQLFCRFTEEARLKAVVKRARAIHAADSSFFDNGSAKRVGGVDSFSDLARGFVRATVKRQPNQLLSEGECFQHFNEYCRNNDSAAEVSKRQFKQLIAEVIREEFAVGFRKDLKDGEGRYLRGWKGLAVELPQRN